MKKIRQIVLVIAFAVIAPIFDGHAQSSDVALSPLGGGFESTVHNKNVEKSIQNLAVSKKSKEKNVDSVQAKPRAEPRIFVSDNDPIEPVNRVIFEFNDVVDSYVIRPVAWGYREAAPSQVRQVIRNVYQNLKAPFYILNAALQGNETRLQDASGRFLVNSFFGLLGVFDVATEMGIGDPREDLGQTLAVWGVDSGPYIVLPILGPSNVRDSFGLAGEFFASPTRNVDENWPNYVQGAGLVDLRSRLIGTVDTIKETSIDYYSTMKTFHVQNRTGDIRNETSN